ncbi:type VII secretion integral membrane protein EccD [Dactylosporangium sp. CA-233914]|uniref:type VII secretion integral membrane protein EccD n=1 Tax=Dactylosporangium sp. CA-233914 TaxID=3239934 RepID=UPI003D8EF654
MNSDRGDVCRLMVVGPTSRVDVSVPTHIPLADMMPALLGALGPDLADRGLEHSGWIAQRLGEPALDESRTVGDLGLLDGEVVHVRPRTDQIPPLAYDDLIDGVSAGLGKRSGLWRPETTRLAAVLSLAAWLGVALAAVQLWPDQSRRTVAMAALALLSLVAGFASARRPADRTLAAILGATGLAAGVLAAVDAAIGSPGLVGADAGAGGAVMLPRILFVAVSAGSVVALVAAAFVFPRTGVRQIAMGLATAWLLVSVAVALRLQGFLDWTGVAAVMVTLTTALRPAVPMAAFKLAGLSLPDMPADTADLQQDIDPQPAAGVLAGASAADRFMTALYVALGTASGAALVCLATAPGWAAPVAAWLAGVAQILVTRPMTSAWHRLALAGPALVAMAAWCLTAVTHRTGTAAAVALAGCLILAVASGLAARILPRRRFNPLWGRIGDIAHTVTVTALLPVVVLICGGVDLIRARVG